VIVLLKAQESRRRTKADKVVFILSFFEELRRIVPTLKVMKRKTAAVFRRFVC
jgi:hypothetical protein